MRVIRTCARCGAHEGRVRRLITIGELLDVAVPLDLGDAEPALWEQAYCRARQCVLVALTMLGRSKLATKRLHGRGIRRNGPVVVIEQPYSLTTV